MIKVDIYENQNNQSVDIGIGDFVEKEPSATLFIKIRLQDTSQQRNM